MKLLFAIFFNFFIATQAYACPGCVGSMGNPDEKNIVYYLMGFIALTYIPFFFIYRMIIKYRKANTLGDENSSHSQKS